MTICDSQIMPVRQPPPGAGYVAAQLAELGTEKGYDVAGPEPDKHGWPYFHVMVPGRERSVVLSFSGEVFTLRFPGGYDWMEFAQRDDDVPDVLATVVDFLRAYADPASHEVVMGGPFRRRSELRLANGAVLRRGGWSAGPPDRPQG